MLTFKKRFGVAGAPEIIQVRQLAANGGYADATGVYTGSEEITCSLWPGDDRAQTATLPLTWFDGNAGQLKVEFPLATMATLEVTWYDAMAKLTDGSVDLAAFRLEVAAGPGSADAPKVYHAYQDLTNELPFVGKLANYLEDQSGFIEIAAEARRWIDAAILRAAPEPDWIRYGFASAQSYGSGTWRGGDGIYGSLGQAEDPIIAAALNADQLVITTATGRRFVDASVYYTLGKILKRAVGYQTTNDLMALSADYRKQADDKLRTCTAEIDINGDGWPEYVIPLGRIKVRRS